MEWFSAMPLPGKEQDAVGLHVLKGIVGSTGGKTNNLSFQ
jgi:hypothetical protein